MRKRRKVYQPCADCPGFTEKLECEADEGGESGEAKPKANLIMVNWLDTYMIYIIVRDEKDNKSSPRWEAGIPRSQFWPDSNHH